jgi:hypothetical protein
MRIKMTLGLIRFGVLSMSFAGLGFYQTASSQQGKNTIHIVSARFGGNCSAGSPQGDLTDLVQKACDGTQNCSYSLNGTSHTKGDMCPGINKDFDWTWTCSGHPGHKSGHLDGPADNKTADAYCPFNSEPSLK